MIKESHKTREKIAIHLLQELKASELNFTSSVTTYMVVLDDCSRPIYFYRFILDSTASSKIN